MTYGAMKLTLLALLVMTAMPSMTSAATGSAPPAHVIPLAGPWRFLMNPAEPRDGDRRAAATSAPAALPDLRFDDTIDLPGTTETRGKGPEQPAGGWAGQLTRVRKFDGIAWYERDVEIPAAWAGRRVTLFLERTKFTRAWLDGRPLGENPILCAPQEYVIAEAKPGVHRLTIQVDNTRRPVEGDAHQWSDNTQTNWNGILGRIELRATGKVWLDDVQLYPDAAARAVRVKARLGNVTGRPGRGTLAARSGDARRAADVTWSADGGAAEIQLPLGESAALWDEFHPNLHELTVELSGADDAGATDARATHASITDARTVTFGLRDFRTRGTQFTVNGRPTFLRGKHDACVFPLTGHPPMDVDGWLAYFRTCRQYGINHVRFHSWTPPEAAFTAADQLGVYLQPELPFWGDFTEEVKRALMPEAHAIVRRFGNHPSFVLFTLGNENRHSREIMGSVVRELRELDPRRLYAQGSNAFMWDPILPPGDDFLVSARAKSNAQSPSLTIRGSHATVDGADGHVQSGPANTRADYAKAIAGFAGPVVGHEIGQYTVYPDFREIAKYTGVTRAHNLEHFRRRLESAGMIEQAGDFFRASGALAAICYREELEAALRTPGFGGFQILDLQDFPGQGTALVGMLDAFMDPKGLITPERWRQFCDPVVLLARFDKYTWTADETFKADVQVAHFGERDQPRAALAWSLRAAGGAVIASGKSDPRDVPQGNVHLLASISASLSGDAVAAPAKLTLELALDGTDVRTQYPLWVYPPKADANPSPQVTLARAFDDAARAALASGGRVVLCPDGTRPVARTVGGGFATDFWCWPMFHNKPGTMGLLCDPSHPALAAFPTEFHSNWQWFELARSSQPLVLDPLALPRGYRPIVQVIDNLERVHRLGLVFELKVGPGRLLVCAADLPAMGDRPEARQLLASLLAYAASDKFNPSTEAAVEPLRDLFRTTIPMTAAKATASSVADGWPRREPHLAIDGNEGTHWAPRRAGFGGSGRQRTSAPARAQAPHWLQITWPQPQAVGGAEILFEVNDADAAARAIAYTLEGSADGVTWLQLGDPPTTGSSTGGADARQRISLPNVQQLTAVRINLSPSRDGAVPAVREVRFFPPE